MSSVFTPVEPIPPIELAPGIAMDFQVIPPVSVQKAAHEAKQPLSFLMGSRGYVEDEEPRHRVIIPQPFFLGIFPVTQEQFAVWTRSTDYAEWFAPARERRKIAEVNKLSKEVTFHQNIYSDHPQLPAENLSWYEAKAFLCWLSSMIPAGLESRLPWEAEWEYSCRAGTETEYWSGDGDAALTEVGWCILNLDSKLQTHTVGEKRKPNPWGLHDMHGNVEEWCEDKYDAKAYSKHRKGWQISIPEKNHSPHRVSRGGSWVVTHKGCRSSSRSSCHAALRSMNHGFRVLLSLPGPSGGA